MAAKRPVELASITKKVHQLHELVDNRNIKISTVTGSDGMSLDHGTIQNITKELGEVSDIIVNAEQDAIERSKADLVDQLMKQMGATSVNDLKQRLLQSNNY